MKFLTVLSITLLSLFSLGCGGTENIEGEIKPGGTIAAEPDYEDSDTDNDGELEYEEVSARSSVTARTTNYSKRADSLQTAGDTLVKPVYTDDEYEAAFSTSTTNPKNQVEGGVRPGKKN